MRSKGQKFKEEWAFFINNNTNKIQHNTKCKKCIHDCKQSFRAKLVRCPFFEKKDDNETLDISPMKTRPTSPIRGALSGKPTTPIYTGSTATATLQTAKPTTSKT